MQYLRILTSIGMQSIKSLHFYYNKLDHIPDDQPISKGVSRLSQLNDCVYRGVMIRLADVDYVLSTFCSMSKHRTEAFPGRVM